MSQILVQVTQRCILSLLRLKPKFAWPFGWGILNMTVVRHATTQSEKSRNIDVLVCVNSTLLERVESVTIQRI